MQLIAGRTAQQYNQRKQGKGAYCEDRYHATAIQTDEHLIRCLVYIDLNIVRAGAVKHPSEWYGSGYREIQMSPIRKAIINIEQLVNLCNLEQVEEFRANHKRWVEDKLQDKILKREAFWSESVAVGTKSFLEHTQIELGILAKGRTCRTVEDTYQLKEDNAEYHFKPKKVRLRHENGYFWNENSGVSAT